MRGLFPGVVLCLLCAPAAAQTPFLVGNWFGMDQPDVKSLMWITHWQTDGTFRFQFRHCRKGRNQDLWSDGSWSLRGEMLTVQTTRVNGKPFSQTDLYEVVSHDAQKWTYREMPDRFAYHASRVGDDFKMPSCELTS